MVTQASNCDVLVFVVVTIWERALDPRTKTSTSLIRKRSDTLFSYSHSCSRNFLPFRSKRTSFAFFTLVFSCLHGKKSKSCDDRNNAGYGWHTWRRDNDFWLLWSTKLIFANLLLMKTTFPQNFVADERSATSFSLALHVTDMSTTHADYDQTSELV